MIAAFISGRHPQVSVEASQIFFLQAANAHEPKHLQELHEIYPAYLGGHDFTAQIHSWCKRWNLTFEGQPARWVVLRAKMTLGWWKRGKPSGGQWLTGENGIEPIEPLAWCDHEWIVGVPTILHEGETSPFEHSVKYDLTPFSGETKEQHLKRLLREHRDGIEGLRVAAKTAYVLRRKLVEKTKDLHALEDHLRWAARFQIRGEEVSEILKDFAGSPERGVVDKGINSALKRIGLTRRPSTSIGRPKKVRKSDA